MLATHSIPNPLRMLGIARILAGACFVANGVMTLATYKDLVPQASRLFVRNPGATDAPIRSLLSLVTAPILVTIGFVLIAKSIKWLRRLPIMVDGPVAIDRSEVISALTERDAPAYEAGPRPTYWALRGWLTDQLADMTWWRRDIMNSGARALVLSCGVSLALGLLFVVRPLVTSDDLFGPFPASFVLVLLFVTALWAVLGLMLIPSNGPRIESIEFTLPPQRYNNAASPMGEFVETTPTLLGAESSQVGLTLGIAGIAAQCLMLAWWSLSLIGYPLMATSIIRHSASLIGGIVLFAIGARMLSMAVELLLLFRYQSTVVLIEGTGQGVIVRAAAVRTESRGLLGPRHIIAAVGGSNARETAEGLVALPDPAKWSHHAP